MMREKPTAPTKALVLQMQWPLIYSHFSWRRREFLNGGKVRESLGRTTYPGKPFFHFFEYLEKQEPQNLLGSSQIQDNLRGRQN